jgi:EAL domain-containing protein (putative c-di-GMP-specific phosphodiesterase class I)
MPAQFVSLAEETGDIVPIGRWVLQEAAKQVVDWRRSTGLHHLRLAVNLSMRQLQLRSFEDDVMAVLGQAGLPPGSTILEVNEVALASGVSTAPEVLASLRERGILLALDDFGTSHSSFGTLKDTTVDYVKLDRALVRDAVDRPTSEAVLRTAVELGQAVGAGVVAEGIETTAQLDMLGRLGCEMGQGYFFTRPLDPSDMGRLLAAKSYPWEAQVRAASRTPHSLTASSASRDRLGATGDHAFVA